MVEIFQLEFLICTDLKLTESNTTIIQSRLFVTLNKHTVCIYHAHDDLDTAEVSRIQEIVHIPWDTMNLIDESVDNSLDAFNDLLLACLDDHAPIKTVKIRHKPNPFITADIRDLMKVRDRLHKRARETGMREDWEVFKELRNRVKFVLRKAEREYYNQQIYENKNNSGAMWKTIRSALPNKSGRPSFT